MINCICYYLTCTPLITSTIFHHSEINIIRLINIIFLSFTVNCQLDSYIIGIHKTIKQCIILIYVNVVKTIILLSSQKLISYK